MRTHLKLIVAAAIVGALATGCGKDTPSATGPTSAPAATSASPVTSKSASGSIHASKPCQLVTGAEAAAALGGGGGLKAKSDTASECIYAKSDTESVEVDMDTEEYTPGVVEMVIGMLGKENTKKVDGLGDAAFVYTLGDAQTQYHVWAKGKYVVLIVNDIADGKTSGPAKTLIETAVSRL
jgi:Protein of unknown function (DUF3558)